MKHTFIFLLLFITFGPLDGFAQTRRPRSQQSAPAPFDSVAWRRDNYVINRDSAYANPRIGLQKLINGNRRFIEGKTIRPRQNRQTLAEVNAGQKPFAIIVGCSDSRVPNEIIFDQGLGDLFILRTAGQVMAQASYGSIEFGVEALKTKLIVVLGHRSCGAVDAAMKRPENPPGHIVTLINSIKPAVNKVRAMGTLNLDACIRQNVLEQVNELRELDPVLSKKAAKGEILIVGGVYDLQTGKVDFLPETMPNALAKTE